MSYTTIAFTLLGGIIPSCVWLAFWLREDAVHPEPRWLIGGSFICGGLSVIAAIFAEKYVMDIVSDQTWRYTIWAAIEEIVKLVAVAVIALNSSYNDEPIDAMIYCITVALGFSAIENTLFILSPLSNGFIAQSIATDSMRFVGATLVHIVSSASIGFALGLTFYRGVGAKAVGLVIGILGAILLHTAFNLSIIHSTANDVLKTFMVVWAAVILLIILFEEVKAVHPHSLAS